MEKYVRLVERLIKQTEAGQLNWEPTVSEDAFQVSFDRFTVRIVRFEAEQPYDPSIGRLADDIVVYLRDETGRTIDSFDDNEVRDAFPKKGTTSTAYARMSHLFRLAQRNALGAEEALDDILGQLGGDEELPF